METVDYFQSKGVIGSRNELGSLYVFLDPSEEYVVIALKEMNALVGDQEVNKPYLIESSWTIQNVKFVGREKVTMDVKGYDVCEMRWRVPFDGNWKVVLGNEQKIINAKRGELIICMGNTSYEPLTMTLEYE